MILRSLCTAFVLAFLGFAIFLSTQENGDSTAVTADSGVALEQSSPKATPRSLSSSTPATSSHSSYGIEAKVLEFEAAYYLPRSPERLEAIKRYATKDYLFAITKTGGTSEASRHSTGVTVKIDAGKSWMTVEPVDEGDDSLLEVTSFVSLTTYREGEELNTVDDLRHTTYWIKSDDGWRVYSEAT